MTTDHAQREIPRIRELALSDPEAIGQAGRDIAAGGRTSDGLLRARRMLEARWQLDPASPPDARDYRDAAHALDRAGQPAVAGVLHELADSDAELKAAAQAWTSRYTPLRPEAAGLLAGHHLDGRLDLDAHRPRIGVDGCYYQLGQFRAAPGDPAEPVVLVTAPQARELIAGFADAAAAGAWLDSRWRGAAWHPLADPPVEHLPRVTLEEHALAWSLRYPGAARRLASESGAPAWTADCRHEIHAALHTASRGTERTGWRDVTEALSRRMLRAPGWAADQVGWPFGHHAHEYLSRLAATSVSDQAARHAFAALATDQRQAEPLPPGPGHAPVTRRPASRDQRALRRDAAVTLQLPEPLARPESVGARMRMNQGPRP